MDNADLTFEAFLETVPPPQRAFAANLHEFLMQNGCKYKIELAKSGYLVSYSFIKTKRVLLNFVFRKNKLVARIYGDYVNSYLDFMSTLPESMVKEIAKSPVCRRLLDPAACNARCSMGYDFTVGGVRYQKCKYNCFMFAVDDGSEPFVREFVEREVAARSA